MADKFRLLFRLMSTVSNWWIFFTNKLTGGSGPTFEYKTRSGITVSLRRKTSDVIVFNDIWLDHVYGDTAIDWAGAKTVLDIGAHMGVFMLYAAARCPNARVISYEPEPENVEQLKRNIAINRLEQRCTVEAKAVAGQHGTMKLNVMPRRGEQNSLYRQTEASHAIDVPVVSLQEVFDTHRIDRCDIMKVNCEGAEYDMFYAFSPESWKKVNAIVMNYHLFDTNPQHHPNVLTEFLQKQGFTVKKLSEGILSAVR